MKGSRFSENQIIKILIICARMGALRRFRESL